MQAKIKKLLDLAVKYLQEKETDFSDFAESFRILKIPGSEQKIPHQNLTSVFSQLSLFNRSPDRNQVPVKFLPPQPFSPTEIVYPLPESEFEPHEQSMIPKFQNITQQFVWLEKYGSNRLFNQSLPTLSIYDAIRNVCAVEACVSAPVVDAAKPFLLVVADYSGIQKSVYTITSKGALKTLRARSFLLEMLLEHIIYEVLKGETWRRFQVIYSGGGSFALLLPNTDDAQARLTLLQTIVNHWLHEKFSGKMFLAMSWQALSTSELSDNFNKNWDALFTKLDIQKEQRFFDFDYEELFSPQIPVQTSNMETDLLQVRECQVCRRDDISPDEGEMAFLGENEAVACPLCRSLFTAGEALARTPLQVFRIKSKNDLEPLSLPSVLSPEGWAHYLVSPKAKVIEQITPHIEAIWLNNVWEVEAYTDERTIPLQVCNYVRKFSDLSPEVREQSLKTEKNRQPDHAATFEELALMAQGANFIGALRMDVDNLGRIVEENIQTDDSETNTHPLLKLTALSRNLNLFFKTWLSEICKGNPGSVRQPLNLSGKTGCPRSENSEHQAYDPQIMNGRNVTVIYAGGDDLFIVGAWDETLELAFDIHNCFEAFTANNPLLGISWGFTLHHPKFPLYQMASINEEAQDEAKAEHERGLKNNAAIFFNRELKLQAHKLEEKSREQEVHTDKIKLVLNSNDFEKKAINATRFFKKLREKKELGGSFFYKLFRIIENWREHGKLYMPHVAWLLDKTRPVLNNDEIIQLIQYFQESEINTLHIPLTWVEYLFRGGEKHE